MKIKPDKLSAEAGSTEAKLPRRNLLKAAVGASVFMIVPRHVLGGPAYVAPSDKINIAAVGASGKGTSDIQALSRENIYAICDIDDTRLASTLAEEFALPFRDKVKTYRDYRQMLDNEPGIDAARRTDGR